MADATCRNCRFGYHNPYGASTGFGGDDALRTTIECRRYPPVTPPLKDGTRRRPPTGELWPVVEPDWWCGEFRSKDD
jgi:hypothetical protein